MSPESSRWYLLKFEDSTVFGPLEFSLLKEWAVAAQVSPLDKVSTDNQTWIKAPMVPELEMDWLVEVTTERLYGPTTLGAIREFYLDNELSDTTTLINAKDGSRYPLSQVIGEIATESEEGAAQSDAETTAPPAIKPAQAGIRASLQQRVRELESALLEERRAFDVLRDRHDKLSEAYKSATGQDAPY